MSKSNLTVYALSRYPIERLIPVGAGALAILMMPEPVWTWIPQWIAWAVVIVTGLLLVLMAKRRHPVSQQFSLDETGLLTRTAINRVPVDDPPYVIGHQSRVTALAVYLLLRPARGSVVHRWIFRSQCCERDFRRLCRMVSRTSRLAGEKT